MNPSPSPRSVPSTPAEPNGEGVFQAKLSDSASQSARSPLIRGLALLLLAIGVAVAMILYWLPSERAKWRIAAAQAKWLDDDLAGAIQVLDAAADEFPDNLAIRVQRIQFYQDAKEFEKALVELDLLAVLVPKSAAIMGLKSQVLHQLGRHHEAIAVCKDLLRLADEEWIGSRDHALNVLAYAQAIGNEELDEAAGHMSEALRLHGDHAERLLKQRKALSGSDQELAQTHAAFLDTNGYVSYRLGEYSKARADFEKAVALFERISQQQQGEILQTVRSYGLERLRRSNEQTLAVLLYHRSLAYDQLGMRDEANVDRERIRGLGYEPNDDLF